MATIAKGLAYDEPLIYRENRAARLGAIGEVVDGLYGSDSEQGPLYTSSIEVVSFDPTTLKANWTPIRYAIRHRHEGNLLRLMLQTGRHIEVASGHAVLTLREGTIHPTPACDIEPGDFVVGPRVIPSASFGMAVIALPELLAKAGEALRRGRKYSDFYIRGVPEGAFGRMIATEFNLANWRKRKMLPLRYWETLTPEEKRVVSVGSRDSRKCLPPTVPVDEDLGWLLGLYLAEGHLQKLNDAYDSTNYTVTFSLGPADWHSVIPRLKSILLSKFGVKLRISEDSRSRGVQFRFDHKAPVYYVLRELVGTGAHDKVIPEIILNSPSTVRRAFLSGWMKGDAGVSVSRRLINGISYLFLMERCVNTISLKKESVKSPVVGDRTIRVGPSLMISFPQPSQFSASNLRTTRIYNEPSYPPLQLPNPLRTFALRYRTTQRVTPLILKALEKKVSTLSPYAFAKPKSMKEMRKDGFYRKHVGHFFERHDGILEPNEDFERLKGQESQLETLARSDLSFLEVRAVGKVDYAHELVYDISVPGCENFLAGFGGVFA